MIRRSLFFGLTLILLLAFVFLSVRGCKQEEEPAGQPMETVETSESTATRVLKPQDLEITRSKTAFERTAGTSDRPSFGAGHEIEIFNHGNVPYKELRLQFVYISSTGKVLETRNHTIAQVILPGAVLKLADIRMEGVSNSAAEAEISIVYADIGGSPPAAIPQN